MSGSTGLDDVDKNTVRANFQGKGNGLAHAEHSTAFTLRQNKAHEDFSKSRRKTRRVLCTVITVVYSGVIVHSLIYAFLYAPKVLRILESSCAQPCHTGAIAGAEFIRNPLTIFTAGSFTVIVACIIALGMVGRAQWGAPSKDSPHAQFANYARDQFGQ